MANTYDDGSGLNVNNHYGPRATGGTEGITKTEGGFNEYTINLDDTILDFPFPVGDGVWVTGVFDAFADAPATVTIGGVDVSAATEAVPIEVPQGNTGDVNVTGSTAGTVVVRYANFQG